MADDLSAKFEKWWAGNERGPYDSYTSGMTAFRAAYRMAVEDCARKIETEPVPPGAFGTRAAWAAAVRRITTAAPAPE